MAKVQASLIKKEDFFDLVWQVVRLVPIGRVTTYGAIARYLGSGASARTVGWAMNAAHHAMPAVPAHRVVNRMGMLSGKHHFETPTSMQEALEKEGIDIDNDRILHFHQHFWDPAKELDDI